MKTQDDTFEALTREIKDTPQEDRPYVWWCLYRYIEYFAAKLEGRLTSEGRQFLTLFHLVGNMKKPDTARRIADRALQERYRKATGLEAGSDGSKVIAPKPKPNQAPLKRAALLGWQVVK